MEVLWRFLYAFYNSAYVESLSTSTSRMAEGNFKSCIVVERDRNYSFFDLVQMPKNRMEATVQY